MYLMITMRARAPFHWIPYNSTLQLHGHRLREAEGPGGEGEQHQTGSAGPDRQVQLQRARPFTRPPGLATSEKRQEQRPQTPRCLASPGLQRTQPHAR